MTDHTKLKIAAEAVKQSYADLCEHGGDEFAEVWNTAELAYDDEANPDVVLALIAQIERDELALRALSSVAEIAVAERDQLKAEVAGLRTGYEAYERVNAELKAENETLIAAAQALRDEWRKDQVDAERYRWLRGEYYSARVQITQKDGTMPCVDGEELDRSIDAAMGKGEQS
ncbi:hypothetical protein F0169_00670 [Pseudomonas sp. MAFF 212408]|uniref:Ead/Ea22-like family protein n=1 Tax=Pseudomonas kitaguniensis TaxID=2607908 RepID=A0A5N7KF83_9PSED|nr:hypothetical protein [Pseudomonas kitaguniensis]MPR00709.1 hypothetical protein [Pseudomonas kitaguniensis]